MMPDYGIQIVVPLLKHCEINPMEIMYNFQYQWGSRIVCAENPEWGDPKRGVRMYLLGNGINNMLITYIGEPFSPGIIELVLSNPELSAHAELSDIQRRTLKEHQACIVIDYKIGSPDAKTRISFSAKTLITILRSNYAIGYFNRLAQIYRPKENLISFFQNRMLDAAELFLLFANIQVVDDDGLFWAHTHGLEQFDLPDIQVKTTEKNKDQYYWSLVGDAAIYCIENGPILKINDTCELMGDGIIYRIRAVQQDVDHPFGKYGAIEIAKER